MLNAAAILKIPKDAPEQLFRCAASDVHKAYRQLAMRWHPDRDHNRGSKEAAEVFKHLGDLNDAAEKRIAEGVWFPASGEVEFEGTDGRKFRFVYRASRKTDCGRMLIARRAVAFVVPKSFEDLFKPALARIQAFRFADAKMEQEFRPQLPDVLGVVETRDNLILVVKKDDDAIVLRDLLDQQGGQLDPRHVGWLLGRIQNLTCWLEWAKTVHGDISLDSLFVNPRTHTVALLGGWWFASDRAAILKALPARTIGLLPSDLMAAKRAETRADLELIRALGRELLGDPAGSRLRTRPDVPEALREWVTQAAGDKAVTDFKKWPEVRDRAFGPRKFVDLPVQFDQVYPLVA